MILQHLLNNRRSFYKNKFFTAVVAIFEISVIAYIDYFFGSNINLFVLYLIPCVLATWYIQIRYGLFFVVFAVFISYLSDIILKTNTNILYTSINAIARMSVFIVAVITVDKIKKLTNELERLTLTDPLTQIGNKRAAFARGDEEIQKMKRSKLPLSILFIDLDNFKSVNDTFGHEAGDEVIAKTGATLKNIIRTTDFTARIGGDEFVVMLYDTNIKGALVTAEKIRAELEEIFSNQGYGVTSSIGAATFIKPPHSFSAALDCADSLMYKAKNTSKNAIASEVFNP